MKQCSGIRISVSTDAGDLERMKEILINGLENDAPEEFPRNLQIFTVMVQDGSAVVGGATCEVYWNWVDLKLLWTAESVRGQGIGRQIIKWVEEEARQRGCVGIHVNTYEFQAMEFYQKLGFELFGTLPNHPVGSSRYYLQKRMDGA